MTAIWQISYLKGKKKKSRLITPEGELKREEHLLVQYIFSSAALNWFLTAPAKSRHNLGVCFIIIQMETAVLWLQF